MKIGILADIHEHNDLLRIALQVMKEREVDRIILLGDLFETGEHIVETIQLLKDAGAVGVWGNHELGFCHEPEPAVVTNYDPRVLQFFRTLSAQYEIDDALFTHGIPTWDSTDAALYYEGDKPWMPGSLSQTFSELRHRIFFVGHFHRWFLATDEGHVIWNDPKNKLHPGEGKNPLPLTDSIILDSDRRYFMVVGAVQDHWCATYDSNTSEFVRIGLTRLEPGEM